MSHINSEAILFSHQQQYVGHGGSLVDSSPFIQSIAGSNPTLAAM